MSPVPAPAMVTGIRRSPSLAQNSLQFRLTRRDVNGVGMPLITGGIFEVERDSRLYSSNMTGMISGRR